MVFCWDKHMKECVLKVDTGVKGHRRGDVLLRQAFERARDERLFANNTHVLVCFALHS